MSDLAHDPALIADVLAWLRHLADEAVPPAAALDELGALRGRHPGVGIDLVWDVEPFDASVHYDALLRGADGTTTSLAVTPATDALPWPLRGAQRVGDSVVLDVDGERLDIGDAVRILDTAATDLGVDLAGRLVDNCLLRPLIAATVAAMSVAEVAHAVERFRSHFDLTDDDAVTQWCRVRSLAPADLPRVACHQRALARLRRDGVDGRPLAAWLTQRRSAASIRWHWVLQPDARSEAAA